MTITAIFEKARVDGTAVRVAMMGDEVAINGEWFGMAEWKKFKRDNVRLLSSVSVQFIK